MTRPSLYPRAVVCGALLTALTATASRAANIAFTGTRANVNVLNPPGTGRCAPLNTVNIAPGMLSSTGASNFGSFASTQSHCIPGAPSPANPMQPISDGQFSYDFGSGDTLFGTYTGVATFSGGSVTGQENLTITGGTGKYTGATGFINSLGSLGFAPNPSGPGMVGVFDGRVTGVISLAGAVPEPASWAMMIAGFGLAGSTMRLRPRQRLTA
jgi:hypothetical protein